MTQREEACEFVKKELGDICETQYKKIKIQIYEAHENFDKTTWQKKTNTTIKDVVASKLQDNLRDFTLHYMDEDNDWCDLTNDTEEADLPKKEGLNHEIKLALKFKCPLSKFATGLVLKSGSSPIFKSFGPPQQTFRLHPPQEEALKKIYRNLNKSDSRRFLVIMPTGCGKTLVLGLAPFMVKNVNKVLIIAPDTTISSQIKNNLSEYFDTTNGIIGRIIKNQINVELEKKIGQTSVDALKRIDVLVGHVADLKKINTEQIKAFSADLLIVDEGHHAMAKSWKEIEANLLQENDKLKTILLTATPQRGDGLTYGLPKQELDDDQYYYLYPRKLASSKKFIKNTKLHRISGVIPDDKIDVKGKEAHEIIESEDYLRTMFNKGVDLLQKQRSACGNKPFRMLVTVKTKKAAEEGAKFFNGTYPNLKAAAVFGVLPTESRKQEAMSDVKRRFAQDGVENRIDVVFQCKMLGEGYDNPWISISLFLCPAKSITKLAQTHGRALRRPKYDNYREHLQSMTAHFGLS